MRIGMVARTVPPFDRGGIQVHVRNLCVALSGLGHEVHLFIQGGKIPLDGVLVHPVRVISTPGFTLGSYLSLAHRAARAASRVPLDVLHGHSMYAFGLARRERRPWVVTIHGTQVGELRSQVASGRLDPNHLLTDSACAVLEGYASRRSRAIIAVSEANRAEILDHYAPPPGKVHVVPNGVWADRYRPSDRSADEVVFVGRLHERKGVDRLIDGWPAVAAQHPGTRLVIIGSGEMEGALRARARRLGLSRTVEFAGNLSEEAKAERLSHARLLVMPSLYEGFGLVMIEGMAAALPVVATPVGAVPEVIQDGVNGRITTHDGLAGAISDLLSNERSARAMGQRARETVRARYDWPAVAHLTAKVYAAAMEGPA